MVMAPELVEESVGKLYFWTSYLDEKYFIYLFYYVLAFSWF